MRELDLQAFLFEKESKRVDLLNYAPVMEPSYRVSVIRNHSFELIENTIKPYLDYAGIGVTFAYSNYDDSLSFLELDLNADAIILWLDLSAYQTQDLQGFVEERMSYLRGIFKRNILFAACGSEIKLNIDEPGVVHYNLSGLQTRLADKFFDLRLEAFSGTKLSNLTLMEVSRDLGLNYLPALLKPGLKGLVVDLDNTLYQGVLGEDGVTGVILTEAHYQLQSKLKSLSEQGFFLSIASKNDARDVNELFNNRTDFPLQLDDFVKIYANWESKADSINAIAKELNVSSDSFLFIDDNLGEIASVQKQHPLIKVIWAKENALITYKILSNYPGLLKLDTKLEDSLRKLDIVANETRLKMQNSLSVQNYIKDLEIQLVFDVDNHEQLARVSELSNKTNQFIFSYQRYSTQQIDTLMKCRDSAVVTISLSDKLSNSGIIGVVVVSKHADSKQQTQWGFLDECFVSCRALGRGIDEIIVLGGIRVALDSLDIEAKLQAQFTTGERNTPAEKFSDQYLENFIVSPEDFEYKIPTDNIAVTVK